MNKPKNYETVRLKSKAIKLARSWVHEYNCEIYIIVSEDYSDYQVATEYANEIQGFDPDYVCARYDSDGNCYPLEWENKKLRCDCCKTEHLDIYYTHHPNGYFISFCINCYTFLKDEEIIKAKYEVGISEDEFMIPVEAQD